MRRGLKGGVALVTALAAGLAIAALAAPAAMACSLDYGQCTPPPPPPPPPVCSPIGCPPPEPPVCVEPNCAPPVNTCSVYGSTGVPSVDCLWTNMDETNPVGGAEMHVDTLDSYAVTTADTYYSNDVAPEVVCVESTVSRTPPCGAPLGP